MTGVYIFGSETISHRGFETQGAKACEALTGERVEEVLRLGPLPLHSM